MLPAHWSSEKRPRGNLVTRGENESLLVRTPHKSPSARSVLPIGSLLPRETPVACLAPWNEHCLAYPCSNWLFWGPPSSNEERDAEHPSACSLRWDLFLREGGLGRLPLPKLSAKAPEPGVSAEDSRYPSGLV